MQKTAPTIIFVGCESNNARWKNLRTRAAFRMLVTGEYIRLALLLLSIGYMSIKCTSDMPECPMIRLKEVKFVEPGTTEFTCHLFEPVGIDFKAHSKLSRGGMRQALLSQFFSDRELKQHGEEVHKKRKRCDPGGGQASMRPNTPEPKPTGKEKLRTDSPEVVPATPKVDASGIEENLDDGIGSRDKKMDQVHVNTSVPSDYERMREERIRQNLAQMEELGLLKISSTISQKCDPPKPSRRPNKGQVKAATPLRRSSRVNRSNNEAMGSDRQEANVRNEVHVEEDPCLSFLDSSIKKYICQTSDPCNHLEEHPAEGAEITGYTRSPQACSLAHRVYSVDDLPLRSLLAVGGHQGHTAIYSTHQKGSKRATGELSEPLLSFRSHRGWVSDVQFTSVQPDSSTLLLTSSNDACLKLWDLNQSAGINGQHVPRELLTCDTLHTGGIFSMHELDQNVLTASKDSTCVLSHVSKDGRLDSLAKFDNLHAGVIKCVRWKDRSIFGTAGKDGRVCLVDRRSKDGSVQTIENVHDFDVNIIEWDRHSGNFFLTASFDQFIHLRDVRAPHAPVYSFTGHMLLDSHRCRSIYQPIFVNNGNAVVVSGEKSESLTLYSTRDGTIISRGHIGFDALTLYSNGRPGSTLYATSRHEIQLFQPQFGSTSL